MARIDDVNVSTIKQVVWTGTCQWCRKHRIGLLKKIMGRWRKIVILFGNFQGGQKEERYCLRFFFPHKLGKREKAFIGSKIHHRSCKMIIGWAQDYYEPLMIHFHKFTNALSCSGTDKIGQKAVLDVAQEMGGGSKAFKMMKSPVCWNSNPLINWFKKMRSCDSLALNWGWYHQIKYCGVTRYSLKHMILLFFFSHSGYSHQAC